MKSSLPYKTFNLYNSFNADIPFTERLYKWITTIGRYIIIGVEMVVLSAFVARFIVDQSLNDLKDKVEKNDQALVSLQPKEDYYNRVFQKTTTAKSIQKKYPNTFVDELPKIFLLAGTDVKIISASYDSLTLTLATVEKSDNVNFEDTLRSTILNTDNANPNTHATVKVINVATVAGGLSNKTYKITKN